MVGIVIGVWVGNDNVLLMCEMVIGGIVVVVFWKDVMLDVMCCYLSCEFFKFGVEIV